MAAAILLLLYLNRSGPFMRLNGGLPMSFPSFIKNMAGIIKSISEPKKIFPEEYKYAVVHTKKMFSIAQDPNHNQESRP